MVEAGTATLSTEAIVALVGVPVALHLTVQLLMWRDLTKKLGLLRTGLEEVLRGVSEAVERQISNPKHQIHIPKIDLAQQIADSEARAEKAHARIESNIKDAEGRLLHRIDKQSERIDALHRDLRGLGERVATVEARA